MSAVQRLVRKLRRSLRRDSARAWARIAAIGSVFLCALSLGGAHPETNLVAATSLSGASLFLFLTAAHRQQLSVGPPFFAVALVLLATLSQCVPLPAFLVAALSPAAYDLHETATAHIPSFMTLSVDAPSTAHELLKLVVLLFGSWLSAELFVRRPRDLFGGITLAALSVFALGLLHQLLGWETAYGLVSSAPPFPTSFINPNHAAAFFALGGFCGLGLALTVRERVRFLWAAASVVCASGVVLTLSRGGILAFVGSATLTVAFLAARERLSGRALLGMQLGSASALVIVAYLAYAEVVHELWTLGDDTAISKVFILRAVPSLLADYWAVGVGRGALGAAYPAHQDTLLSKTFTHLENEWLQPFVDWGVFVGTAVVGLGLWTFMVAFRRLDDDPFRIAGLGGLLYLAVHNLADFNVSLTGVGLPAVMIATVLVSTPQRSRTRQSDGSLAKRLRVSRRAAILSSASALGVVAAVSFFCVSYTLERDTGRLRALLTEADYDSFEQGAEVIVARHPSDFVLPLMIGVRALEEPDGPAVALAWINRSMVRAPLEPVPHRLAGRALWRLGAYAQSMLEFRLADNASSARRGIVGEILDLTTDPRWLGEFIDSSVERRLVVARQLAGRKHGDEALALIEIPELDASAERYEIAARVARERNDTDAVLLAASALLEADPAQPNGYQLKVEALLRLDRTDEAISLLRRGLESVGPTPALMTWLVRALIRDHRYTEAKEVAKKLLSRSLRPSVAADAHGLLGQILMAEGQTQRALREFEKARDRSPDKIRFRYQIASLKERLGNYRGALEELDRIEAQSPGRAATLRLRKRIEAADQRAQEAATDEEERRRFEALLEGTNP